MSQPIPVSSFTVERVTSQEWDVYKIFGEAALATLGKIYDYYFISEFVNQQYAVLLGNTTVNNKVGSAVFIMKDNGKIVGVIAGSLIGKVCQEICWYVKPEYRNGRHGLTLLRELEKWAKENKANYISISRFVADKKNKNYTRYKELLLKDLRTTET